MSVEKLVQAARERQALELEKRKQRQAEIDAQNNQFATALEGGRALLARQVEYDKERAKADATAWATQAELESANAWGVIKELSANMAYGANRSWHGLTTAGELEETNRKLDAFAKVNPKVLQAYEQYMKDRVNGVKSSTETMNALQGRIGQDSYIDYLERLTKQRETLSAWKNPFEESRNRNLESDFMADYQNRQQANNQEGSLFGSVANAFKAGLDNPLYSLGVLSQSAPEMVAIAGASALTGGTAGALGAAHKLKTAASLAGALASGGLLGEGMASQSVNDAHANLLKEQAERGGSAIALTDENQVEHLEDGKLLNTALNTAINVGTFGALKALTTPSKAVAKSADTAVDTVENASKLSRALDNLKGLATSKPAQVMGATVAEGFTEGLQEHIGGNYLEGKELDTNEVGLASGLGALIGGGVSATATIPSMVGSTAEKTADVAKAVKEKVANKGTESVTLADGTSHTFDKAKSGLSFDDYVNADGENFAPNKAVDEIIKSINPDEEYNQELKDRVNKSINQVVENLNKRTQPAITAYKEFLADKKQLDEMLASMEETQDEAELNTLAEAVIAFRAEYQNKYPDGGESISNDYFKAVALHEATGTKLQELKNISESLKAKAEGPTKSDVETILSDNVSEEEFANAVNNITRKAMSISPEQLKQLEDSGKLSEKQLEKLHRFSQLRIAIHAERGLSGVSDTVLNGAPNMERGRDLGIKDYIQTISKHAGEVGGIYIAEKYLMMLVNFIDSHEGKLSALQQALDSGEDELTVVNISKLDRNAPDKWVVMKGNLSKEDRAKAGAININFKDNPRHQNTGPYKLLEATKKEVGLLNDAYEYLVDLVFDSVPVDEDGSIAKASTQAGDTAKEQQVTSTQLSSEPIATTEQILQETSKPVEPPKPKQEVKTEPTKLSKEQRAKNVEQVEAELMQMLDDGDIAGAETKFKEHQASGQSYTKAHKFSGLLNKHAKLKEKAKPKAPKATKSTTQADLFDDKPTAQETATAKPAKQIDNVSEKSEPSMATFKVGNLTHHIPSELVNKTVTLKDVIDVLQQMRTEGRVDDAKVEDVNASREYSKKVLKEILKYNPDVKITIVDDLKHAPKAYQLILSSGGYKADDENGVWIYPNSDEWEYTVDALVNHELVHTLTQDILRSDFAKQFRDEIERLQKDLLNNIWVIQDTKVIDEVVRPRVGYLSKTADELFSVVIAEYNVRQQLDPSLIKEVDNLFQKLLQGDKDESTQSTDSRRDQKTYTRTLHSDPKTEGEVAESNNDAGNNRRDARSSNQAEGAVNSTENTPTQDTQNQVVSQVDNLNPTEQQTETTQVESTQNVDNIDNTADNRRASDTAVSPAEQQTETTQDDPTEQDLSIEAFFESLGLENLLSDEELNQLEDSADHTFDEFTEMKGFTHNKKVDVKQKGLNLFTSFFEKPSPKEAGKFSPLAKAFATGSKLMPELYKTFNQANAEGWDVEQRIEAFKQLGLPVETKEDVSALGTFTQMFAELMSGRSRKNNLPHLAQINASWSYQDVSHNLVPPDPSKVDENVVATMLASGIAYLRRNPKPQWLNESEVVEKLFNGKEYMRFKDRRFAKRFATIGMPINHVALEIGKDIIRSLGIKPLSHAPVEFETKLAVTLGAKTLWALDSMGYAHITRVPPDWLEMVYEDLGIKLDKELKFANYYVVPISNTDKNGFPTQHQSITDLLEAFKDTKLLDSLIHESYKRNTPSDTPIEFTETKVKKSSSSISKIAKKVLSKMAKQEWKINNDNADVLQTFLGMDDETALAMMGYDVSEETLGKLHITQRESALATAQAALDTLKNDLEYISSREDREASIYIKPEQYSNFRFGYATHILNAQQSTVSRMLVGLKGFKTTFDPNAEENQAIFKDDQQSKLSTYGNFLMALAERMEGIEIYTANGQKLNTVDKQHPRTYLPVFEEYLKSDKVQSAIESMIKVLNKEDVSPEEVKAMSALIKEWDMNALSTQALIELAKYEMAKRSGKEYTTTLTRGSDGTTNGPAINWVMFATAPNAFLEKFGLLHKDNPADDYHTAREQDGFFDYYEVGAKNTKTYWTDVFNKTLPNLSSKGISLDSALNRFLPALAKAARKLGKEVLTPTNYGSGMTGVTNKGGSLMVAGVEQALADTQNEIDKLETEKAQSQDEAQKQSLDEQIQALRDKLRNELVAVIKFAKMATNNIPEEDTNTLHGIDNHDVLDTWDKIRFLMVKYNSLNVDKDSLLLGMGEESEHTPATLMKRYISETLNELPFGYEVDLSLFDAYMQDPLSYIEYEPDIREFLIHITKKTDAFAGYGAWQSDIKVKKDAEQIVDTFLSKSQDLRELQITGDMVKALFVAGRETIGKTMWHSFSMMGKDYIDTRNYITEIHSRVGNLTTKLFELAYKDVEEKTRDVTNTADGNPDLRITGITRYEFKQLNESFRPFMPMAHNAFSRGDYKNTRIPLVTRKTRKNTDVDTQQSLKTPYGTEQKPDFMQLNAEKPSLESSTLAQLAAYTQSIDSAIAMALQASEDIDAMNMHDSGEVGINDIEQAGRIQNKAYFEMLKNNHFMYNAMEAVVNAVENMVKDPEISKLLTQLIQIEKKDKKLEMSSIGGVYNALSMLESFRHIDLDKLNILKNLKAVQQYIGYGTAFKIDDKEVKSLDKAIQKLEGDYDKLFARVSNITQKLDNIVGSDKLLLPTHKMLMPTDIQIIDILFDKKNIKVLQDNPVSLQDMLDTANFVDAERKVYNTRLLLDIKGNLESMDSPKITFAELSEKGLPTKELNADIPPTGLGVARLIKEYAKAGLADFKLTVEVKDNTSQYGYFDFDNKQIVIYVDKNGKPHLPKERFTEFLAHELFHANSVLTVQLTKAKRAELKTKGKKAKLSEVDKQRVEALNRLQALMQRFLEEYQKDHPDKYDAMLARMSVNDKPDVEEFAAIMSSDPDVIRYGLTKRVERAGRKFTSIFKSFMRLVFRMMGIQSELLNAQKAEKKASKEKPLSVNEQADIMITMYEAAMADISVLSQDKSIIQRSIENSQNKHVIEQAKAVAKKRKHMASDVHHTSIDDLIKNSNRTGVSDELVQNVNNLLQSTFSFKNFKKTDWAVNTPDADSARNADYVMSDFEHNASQYITAVLKDILKANQSPEYIGELRKLFVSARKVIRPRDLYDGDWEQADSFDMQEAQNKWNYLFAKKGSAYDTLARFGAMVIANQEVNQLLSKKNPEIIKARNVPQTFIEKALDVVYRAFNHFSTQVAKANPKQVQSLVENLVNADSSIRKKALTDKQNWYDVVSTDQADLTAKALNTVANMVETLPSKTAENIATVVKSMAKGHTREIIAEAKVLRDDLAPNKPLDEVSQIINEVVTPNDVMRQAEEYLISAKRIERARQVASKATKDNLRKAFKTQLDKEQKTAVSKVLLATDTASLLDGYDLRQIHEFISNPDALDSAIHYLEQQVNQLDNADFIKIKAMDLARYMVDGHANPYLLLNAHSILFNSGAKTIDNEALRRVDLYTSLKALQYTDPKLKQQVDKLFEQELARGEHNGIAMVLKTHQALNKEYQSQVLKADMFNIPKGYIPEITDPAITQIMVSSNDVESHIARGYKVAKEYRNNQTLPDHVLMIKADGGGQRRVSGALSFQRFGINKTKTKTPREMVGQLSTKGINAKHYDPFKDTTRNAIPSFDATGQVIGGYLTEDYGVQDHHLKRNHNFEDTLSYFSGHILDKQNLGVNNEQIIQGLIEYHQKNFNNNPKRFVLISPDSQPDLWHLMTPEVRKQIRDLTGQDALYVPNEIINTIFGYRKFALGDLLTMPDSELGFFSSLIKHSAFGLLRDNAQDKLYKAGRMWAELVAFIKDAIVIRSGGVLLGNIQSNILLQLAYGVNPYDAVKHTYHAIKYAAEYRKDSARLAELNHLIKTKQGDIGKLYDELRDVESLLETNPLNNFINQGMLTSLVEDVEIADDGFSYTSRIQDKIKQFTRNVPDVVMQGVNELMMMQGSQMHTLMADATQLSDFTAKYVMYKHALKKGKPEKEAIEFARDSFINYDIPTSRTMQWLNDSGLMMFTKFFFRFQRVLAHVFKHHPLLAGMQSLAVSQFTSMATILEPFFLNQLGNPFEQGPLMLVDVVGDIMTIGLVT